MASGAADPNGSGSQPGQDTSTGVASARTPKGGRWVNALTLKVAKLVDPYVDLFLTLAIVLLFLVAVWVLADAINQFFCHGGSQCAQVTGTEHAFTVKIPRIVSDGLLIVIVMEIVETIRRQVLVSGRIYPDLVRNFLIVGIVSAIRHLLAVGAQFSLQEGTPDLHLRASLMWELGLNAGIVLALLAGWIAARGLEQPSGGADLDPVRPPNGGSIHRGIAMTWPPGERAQLVQDLALGLLAGPAVPHRRRSRHRSSFAHRQRHQPLPSPASQTGEGSVFRGHRLMRHRIDFADIFGESTRVFDIAPQQAVKWGCFVASRKEGSHRRRAPWLRSGRG